jgi:hypothetical protein
MNTVFVSYSWEDDCGSNGLGNAVVDFDEQIKTMDEIRRIQKNLRENIPGDRTFIILNWRRFEE